MRDHQHPVQIDGHRPAPIGRFPSGQPPVPLTCFGPRGTDRRQSFPAGGCEGVGEADTVGPNTAGSARSMLLHIVFGYLVFVFLMSALAGIVVGWLTRKASGNAWGAAAAGIGAAVVFAGLLTNALPPILKFLGVGF